MVSVRPNTPEPRTANNPKLMSIRELADELSISLGAAYELASKDELPIPTIRVGRQYRFRRADLQNLIEGEERV